jgi:hypothetical protein
MFLHEVDDADCQREGRAALLARDRRRMAVTHGGDEIL